MSSHARHRAQTPAREIARATVAEIPTSSRVMFAVGAAVVTTGGIVALSATPAQAYEDNGNGTVTVQSGDTVSEIAVSEGLRTQEMLDSNGLGWSTLIFPGQVLRKTGSAPAPLKAPAPATATTPAPTHSGEQIVALAREYLGVPYLYGGSTPAGFDCSGLTQYVAAKAGISLPRTSSEQKSSGYAVSAADAQPGDLVTFNALHHVAIYAGGGLIIDAPHPGAKVGVRRLWTSDVTYRRIT